MIKMVKLMDIHTKYSTDKGTDHNYIDVYDELLAKYQSMKGINVLEVGVFTGGSLKMFNEYFDHAIIYGIDPFIRTDNDALSKEFLKNGATCLETKLMEDLKSYDRIKIVKGYSQSVLMGDTEFAVIIDDGDHRPKTQFETFINLEQYVTADGVYIIEDIQSKAVAEQLLKQFELSKYSEKWNFEPRYLNIKKRPDDILIICTRKTI